MREIDTGATSFIHGGQEWTLSQQGSIFHVSNLDGSTQGTGLDRRAALGGVFDLQTRRRVETELSQLDKEESDQQDVPLHQGDLTSSVGALWKPEMASFNRKKGIYSLGIVRDKESLVEIINEINDTKAVFNGEVSRISLRAVVDLNYLRQLSDNEAVSPLVEGIIPLQGTQPAFENSALVYFGANHSTRQPLSHEIAKYEQNLEQALLSPVQTPQQIAERVRADGYEVRTLEKGSITEETIDQVAQLYERFGWTREEVVSILNNKNNIIGVAIKEGQIVSAGIAEMAAIPIGKNTLRIVEITEAATREDHARNGLYTAVSSSLLAEIASRSKKGEILGGEVDVVYGECNGNALGVLKTAHVQGREFARKIGSQFGFPDSGILFQHVPISGAPKETPYNDLYEAYITKENLYKIYLQ